jgi:MFS family permease
MLGMVSLFADMAYEGGGSVTGSYMELLGASALLTGLLSVPDFLSYFSRLVGGWVASRSASSIVYWGLVFIGYVANFSMPLLALAGRPELVILLVFVERIGKGLRGPVRDVILSEVTKGMGRGKGFGLHEVMDQTGAIIGPLCVGYALYVSNNNYSYAFSILTIPVILSLICLSIAAALYPKVEAAGGGSGGKSVLGRVFWIYAISSSLMMFGFMQWRSIISYYFRDVGIIPDYYIALLYTLAMGVDAIVALPMGLAYDRYGLKVISVAPVAALLIPAMILSNNIFTYVLAASLWGIFMGAYETIMRAAVADLVGAESRAYAYGVYSFLSGVSWMIGTVIMAYLLETFSFGIIVLSLASEGLALILLVTLLGLKSEA